MSVDDELSKVIGLVYDAALEPDRWPLVLRRTADLIRADSGLLGVGSHRKPSAGMAVPLTLEVDPVQQQRWVESYLPLDLWWLAFSERFEEGVLTGAQCVDPRTLHRGTLYNEVLIRAGVEDGIFAGIARLPGSDAIAAFYRGRRRERFGAGELELLARLLPHLRRAVRVNDLIGRLEAERDASRAASGSLPVGLIHLDGRGCLLDANAHAQRLLDARDGLVLRGRRLCASDERDRAALDRAIAAALGTHSARVGGVLSLAGSSAAVSLVLCVTPIPHETERPLLAEPGRRAEVAVLVTSTEALAPWPVREAARVLRLTPAEAELALALARGHDLEEHAAHRGIALGTARWHMKRILDKTGSRRQSDVVRLVLTTLGRLATAGSGKGADAASA